MTSIHAPIQRRATITRRLSLPTSVLPRLPPSIDNDTTTKLLGLVAHLRSLYVDPAAVPAPKPRQFDSGYSSAIDDGDDDDDDEQHPHVGGLGQEDQVERAWAKTWLNGIMRYGEDWINETEEETEKTDRCRLVDEAAALIATLSETSASGSILRPLLLPTCAEDAPIQTEPLLITLNDGLPSSLDPTSVGLQSWGSSIILGRMIALDPVSFGVGVKDQRTLELGAGTGLLSLVWKGMSERLGAPGGDVIATDNHAAVLANLMKNVHSNTPAISPANSPLSSPNLLPADVQANGPPVVAAHKLDWAAVHSSRMFASSSTSGGLNMPPPFHKPFHTLLGADIIYGPEHALWLKSCVEQFLIKLDAPPSLSPPTLASFAQPTALPPLDLDGPAIPPPVPSAPVKAVAPPPPAFHLIVPLRPTHVAAIASITQVFPNAADLPPREPGQPWRVAIKKLTELQRVRGVGRADEASYKLFEIGWC